MSRKEVLVCQEHEITAVDCLAQNIRWTWPCEGMPLSYSVATFNQDWAGSRKGVIFADSSGGLTMLSGINGNPVARIHLEEKPATRLLCLNDRVFFVGDSGHLFGLKIMRAGR